MYIGTSLVLFALGAIIKFATNVDVEGIELDTVGVILMIVGAIGFLLALGRANTADETVVVDEHHDHVHRPYR